jgi:MFS family permease
MLLAILAAWFGYKKANESGRNGLLWAFICAGAFIGTQLGCGLLFGLFLGLGVAAFGWSENIYETYSVLINLAAIVLSVFVVYLLFRYLDRLTEDDPKPEVPPPPTFD